MDATSSKNFIHCTYAPVAGSLEPERIDSFLTRMYPDYSRSYFQKLVDQEAILLNDKVVKKPSITPKSGDTISVWFPPVVPYNLEPQEVDFEVIDIQDDFLIVFKPAGLAVHPSTTADTQTPTLVHGLLHRFKELGAIAETERPGIVHRLDKDTSGLLIIARNEKSCAKFSTMFANRTISKTYLALVVGHPEQMQGSIEYEIGRHPVDRHKMSHRGINSRPALTHYKVVAYYNQPIPLTKNVPLAKQGSALVEVTIVTGRTHQIRVHMAALGHELLGDKVYGKSSPLIDRQALHAWKISFEYGGKQYSYCKEVPEDMQRLIDLFAKD